MQNVNTLDEKVCEKIKNKRAKSLKTVQTVQNDEKTVHTFFVKFYL